MKLILILISAILFIVACRSKLKDKHENLTPIDKVAIEKINNTIAAHGGNHYENAHYKFVFRDKEYTFKNGSSSYVYTRNIRKEGKVIYDELDNGVLKRKVDGEEVSLSEKEAFKVAEAINSVVYFATLPHKLNDEAVYKYYEGITVINNKVYDIIKVTFDQEGGGTDYEDTYYYWINKSSSRIDYLAYNFKVNDGGVRFRSAFNPRVIDGILFQDYINYKAPKNTKLSNLPGLYEEGKLEELSKIITENVVKL